MLTSRIIPHTVTKPLGAELRPSDRVLVCRRQYGFDLKANFDIKKQVDEPFEIPVFGHKLPVDDLSYLTIETPQRTLFLGTHHGAAYIFMMIAYQSGLVTGGERLLHLDHDEHPDVDSYFGKILNAGDDLGRHALLYAPAANYRNTINLANYRTLLREIFPEMEQRYYSYNCFNPTGTYNEEYPSDITKFSPAAVMRKRCITSLDLDIYSNIEFDMDQRGYVNTTFERPELTRVLQQYLRRCRVSMLFLSPGYVEWEPVSEIAGRLIEDAALNGR